MSKLSELLNPVPSSCSAPGSAPGPRPLQLDTISNPGEDQLSPTSHVQVGSPTQRSILESPLGALATAATGGATLYSPPHPTMASLPPLGAGYQNPSPLRPTSSQGSPPLSLELSRQPERPLGAFSPGLEKYHHASSDEVKSRRLSVVADGTSQTLAPLMRSSSDENTKTPIPQLEPAHVDSEQWSHGKAFTEPVHAPLETPQREQNQESREARRTSSVQPETTHFSQATQPTEEESDEVEVKAEMADSISGVLKDNPEDGVRTIPYNETSSHMDETTREPTPRIIANVKPDVGYQPTITAPGDLARSPSANPKSIPSKRSAAPKSKVEKKGTASTVKGSAKKRKTEPDSATGTPSVHRSGTPASSRASKTPAPRNRKQNSVTPARSSSIAVVNETEDDEDAELFCICRKPDDHTWMIACDGPCEDWFHGKCVNMNEKDGNLIDKYICPNCHANGVGQTTWKPMCRLESCRNPARVTGPKPSKYCSDEHGVEYMKNHAMKQENEAQAGGTSSRRKKRRRDNYTDHFGNGEFEDMLEPDNDRSHLQGGILHSGELKALADGVRAISEFRKLGDGVLSPPRTASPDADGNTAPSKFSISYSPDEMIQLNEIAAKEDALRRRKTMLDHRERFLLLVRARAKRALDQLRKKETVKDICGFDARLSWSDEEFQAWCASPEGIQSLENGNLCAPSAISAPKANIPIEPSDPATPLLDGEPGPHANDSANGGGVGGGPGGAEDEEEELGRGVCQKRRCERHKTWWKLQQQDVAFERDEVRQALRRLEAEGKGVRKRALIRGLEDDERRNDDGDAGSGGADGAEDDNPHRDGRDDDPRSMSIDRDGVISR